MSETGNIVSPIACVPSNVTLGAQCNNDTVGSMEPAEITMAEGGNSVTDLTLGPSDVTVHDRTVSITEEFLVPSSKHNSDSVVSLTEGSPVGNDCAALGNGISITGSEDVTFGTGNLSYHRHGIETISVTEGNPNAKSVPESKSVPGPEIIEVDVAISERQHPGGSTTKTLKPSVTNSECDLSVPQSTQGNTVPKVFAEIDEILEEQSSPPLQAPLLTLSQFDNTAHAGADMVVEETSFSQDPSFHQWMKGNPEAHIRTPYKGVSIVSGNSAPEETLKTKDSTCRNLRATFDEEEDLEVTAAELVNLSQRSEKKCKKIDGEVAIVEDKDLANVMATDPWPGCAIVGVEDVAVMTLSQAYHYLHMEDFLQTLPGRQGRRDGADEVIFFNEKKKELEVKFQEIRDLKRARTRLGNNIVDFVMSRVYFQYPSCYRHEVLFTLSRVSSTFRCSMSYQGGVLKWATTILQPPTLIKVHQIKEIFVPWVDHDHWSLLVFQYDKVVHLDSPAAGKYHDSEGRDSDFVEWISHAWQTLRGVEPYNVSLVRLEVYRKSGIMSVDNIRYGIPYCI